MTQKIIPIFVIYKGCPNRCVYCNERITAGNHPDRITEDLFRKIVDKHLKSFSKPVYIQIAFYGGNFTGIDRHYQTELLEYAESYIRKGLVNSIRISTRPDYIDDDRAELLKRYHVKTVEIGAQSMVDKVLNLSNRGHSSDDVRRAIEILKAVGFETGIHLMVGLPGDTEEKFRYTVEETIKLNPQMVRIHPTIVFQDTALAKSYQKEEYKPISMADAIKLCKYALGEFETANIPVIRVGLQMTGEMEREGSIIAGPYHPAFRSLVEAAIFFDMASKLLKSANPGGESIKFFVNPKDISDLHGMRNQNIKSIKERFGITKVLIREDSKQERGTLALAVNEKISKLSKLQMSESRV
jgi:histone acetyltransferase (RNA polymerase elongator complex component)